MLLFSSEVPQKVTCPWFHRRLRGLSGFPPSPLPGAAATMPWRGTAPSAPAGIMGDGVFSLRGLFGQWEVFLEVWCSLSLLWLACTPEILSTVSQVAVSTVAWTNEVYCNIQVIFSSRCWHCQLLINAGCLSCGGLSLTYETLLGMVIAAISRNWSRGLDRNCLWKHLFHLSIYDLLLEKSFKSKKRLFNIIRSPEWLTNGCKSHANAASPLPIDTQREDNSPASACTPLLPGSGAWNATSSEFRLLWCCLSLCVLHPPVTCPGPRLWGLAGRANTKQGGATRRAPWAGGSAAPYARAMPWVRRRALGWPRRPRLMWKPCCSECLVSGDPGRTAAVRKSGVFAQHRSACRQRRMHGCWHRSCLSADRPLFGAQSLERWLGWGEMRPSPHPTGPQQSSPPGVGATAGGNGAVGGTRTPGRWDGFSRSASRAGGRWHGRGRAVGLDGAGDQAPWHMGWDGEQVVRQAEHWSPGSCCARQNQHRFSQRS